MPVVSVSLTEKNIESLEMITQSLGLAGRSEAVRACLRSAEAEMRERESLRGEVEGILIIVHGNHCSPGFDRARHHFQDIITTQIHSHLRNHKCLEIFIVRGVAEEVKQMLSTFRADGDLEYVKFVIS